MTDPTVRAGGALLGAKSSLRSDRGATGVALAVEPAAQLVVNTAPQDGEVFLTWNPVDGSLGYTVYWRKAGTENWENADVGPRLRHAITNLDNGIAYEFKVVADAGRTDSISSSIETQTPRLRDECSSYDTISFDPPVVVFCSQAAFTSWMQANLVNPWDLKCRGKAVTEWNEDAPNCVYTSDNVAGWTGTLPFQFLLDRSVANLFSPPSELRQPNVTRSIARRAIWPGRNPFDDPLYFPVQISSAPAYTGSVTSFVTARSYDISYAPLLTSRVTWFIPSDPIPGRYAIYHGGHGDWIRSVETLEPDNIDWLLQRGWQVIAMDMPLVGSNSNDRTGALKDHSSIGLFDDGQDSPLSLFLIPVKTVTDMIEEDAGKNELTLLMMGTSGGGWTSFLYSALDPRVSIAVPLVSGLPKSLRLKKSGGGLVSDYEQQVPNLYDVAPYEDLMRAAGSVGSFYYYGLVEGVWGDPGVDFVKYLTDGTLLLQKHISVYVDPTSTLHAISADGKIALDRFLKSLTLEFASSAYKVMENERVATINVKLDAPSPVRLSVDYAATAGTATADVDFTPVAGTLTFEPGDIEKSFTLPVFANPTNQSERTVYLALKHASGAILGRTSRAILTIFPPGSRRRAIRGGV